MKLRGRLDLLCGALLFTLGLASCGGSAVDSGDGAGSAGTRNGGPGGAGSSNAGAAGSATGGMASAGRGGLGSAGNGGTDNRFPCKNPMVLGNGFISCDGFTHRQHADTMCPSQLPRPEPFPDAPADALCKSDSDCTALPHGWCGRGVASSSPRPVCNYGCVQDSECPGQVCLCANPVGRCVQANCMFDSDCGNPAFLCESVNDIQGCLPGEFVCQSTADECGSTADCVTAGTGNLCKFDFEALWHYTCVSAGCAVGP